MAKAKNPQLHQDPSTPAVLESSEQTLTPTSADAPVDAKTDEPIQIVEEVRPKRPETTMRAKEWDDLHYEAETENKIFDHMAAIRAAANPVVKPYTPPAMSERVRRQTEAEMACGAARIKAAAEAQQNRPLRVPDKWDGKNEEIFRPDQYFHEKDTAKSRAV